MVGRRKVRTRSWAFMPTDILAAKLQRSTASPALIWPWAKSKSVSPQCTGHNATTKIGSKMAGEFTYPKMVPLVFDPQPSGRVPLGFALSTW